MDALKRRYRSSREAAVEGAMEPEGTWASASAIRVLGHLWFSGSWEIQSSMEDGKGIRVQASAMQGTVVSTVKHLWEP